MSRSVGEPVVPVADVPEVAPVALEVRVAMLAIEGAADPPPQPAESSPNPSAARPIRKERTLPGFTPPGKHHSLKRA